MDSDLLQRLLRKPPSAQYVSNAEFTALRTIVMALVATAAKHHADQTNESPQSFINELSVLCQNSILNALLAGDKRETDRVRAEIIDRINGILAGVRVGTDGDEPKAN
jgi:hypothetical protein